MSRDPASAGASSSAIVDQLRARGADVLAELFQEHASRLKAMLGLRMDRRLQGRLDPSDILQEAYIEASRRLPRYLDDPSMPVFLWLRFLTAQKLVDLHRMHLGAKMRDAAQEVSLRHGPFPEASSVSLAAQLLGKQTSVSQAFARAELQLRVQEALNSMDPVDREVLTLRHFEMLTNDETAEVLGLSKQAASNRFVRALRRLKGLLGPA